ncbi:hypothetical protein [Phormidesmis priestleyi]
MEPVTWTAGAIAKLAFDEFVKSGAGEVAKKTVGSAIEQLRSVIRKRFAGNKKAEEAIVKIEEQGSTEALNKLSGYLDDEMNDKTFAQALQQLAQQVDQTVMQQENRNNAKGYQIRAERIDHVGDSYGK